MILGAIAAGASYFTGGLEANRVFDAMSEPAKRDFGRHAKLGTYMAVVFGVLAVWRILIQASRLLRGLAIDLFDRGDRSRPECCSTSDHWAASWFMNMELEPH